MLKRHAGDKLKFSVKQNLYMHDNILISYGIHDRICKNVMILSLQIKINDDRGWIRKLKASNNGYGNLAI